jgi:hypothetical protein
MADGERVKQMVILMIWGDSLEPARVLSLLGVKDWKPQQAWSKGHDVPVTNLDGSTKPSGHRYEFGAVRLWPKREWLDQDLETQLERWAELLSPLANHLKVLQQEGSSITLQCAVLDRGIYGVGADVQSRLGRLGVDLALEVSVPRDGQIAP